MASKPKKQRRPKEQTARAHRQTKDVLEKIAKSVIRDHQNGDIAFEDLRGAIARQLHTRGCSLHIKVRVTRSPGQPRTVKARFTASWRMITVNMEVSRTHSLPAIPPDMRTSYATGN